VAGGSGGSGGSEKCNDLSGERACPTVVDAVRLLRAKVEKSHGVGRCITISCPQLELDIGVCKLERLVY